MDEWNKVKIKTKRKVSHNSGPEDYILDKWLAEWI